MVETRSGINTAHNFGPDDRESQTPIGTADAPTPEPAITRLQTQLEQLQLELEELRSQKIPTSDAPRPPDAPPPPCIALPGRFNGDRDECRGFVNQLRLF